MQTENATCAPPATPPFTVLPSPSETEDHRRTGKVASLSKKDRDALNQMLDDGIQYEDIIQRLGDAGKNLNKQNIHIPHENLKISRASAKYHDMSHCCNCAN